MSIYTRTKTALHNKTTEFQASWRQMRTEVKFETVLNDLRGDHLVVELTKIGGASTKGNIVKVKHDTIYFRAHDLLAGSGFDGNTALLEIPIALVAEVKVFAPVAPAKTVTTDTTVPDVVEDVVPDAGPTVKVEPVEGDVVEGETVVKPEGTEEAGPIPPQKRPNRGTRKAA